MDYSVITSRRAQNELNKIKSEHADLLTTMGEQKDRVQMFNQQKSMEQQQKAQADQQMMQEQQKTQQETALKTQELQLKKEEVDIMRVAAQP